MGDRSGPAAGRASVIIVNTNELHYLRGCLPSVLRQDYPDFETIVVDNASTDGSADYVKREFPQVKLVSNTANLGYAGANNVGFENATGQYLVVLNPDTKVEPDWLRELVRPLENSASVGLATSRILLMNDSQRINACGNEVTFAGITVCRGLGEPVTRYPELELVSAVSGAAFAVKRSVLEHIGPFDESFFIYYEDTDLSLRAGLAGYECVYAARSIVYHDYRFGFSARKCFLQERNRLYSWLKTFRWGTLIALLPALLLAELLAWGYALLQGADHVREKARSHLWLASNWREIAEGRRRTQALRQVSDRQLLRLLSHRLTLADTTDRHLGVALEAVLRPTLWLWGKVCQAVVVW